MEKILTDDNGTVYMNAEALIDMLIYRIDLLAMEIEVYRDGWDEAEFAMASNQIKGYAKCIKSITDEYISLTPRPDRAMVYQGFADQMTKIVED